MLTINQLPVAYSEPRQISKMNFFAKTVNVFQLLTFFAKSSVLDVWYGSNTPLSHSNQFFVIPVIHIHIVFPRYPEQLLI